MNFKYEDCISKFKLIDKNNMEVTKEDESVIEKVKKLLKEGKIIAIKGLGGFQLVCDGTNYKSIADLRKRKNRIRKPLTVIMKDIEEVHKYCFVNEKEKKLLTGHKKPIVILKKKNNQLPNNISFNSDSLGITLPQTHLHSLLFDDEIKILAMTNGNLDNMPIIYKDEEALSKLNEVADYFLIHDKEIYKPVKDLVVKVILNEERIIRFGRGYNSVILNNREDNFNKKDLYEHYLKVKDCEKDDIYHHHAHIVSCMFENNIDEKVIGLSFDKSENEEDKNYLGSEFLICDKESFKRVGHLRYMKMPGGDNAIREPWKMAVSLLHSFVNNNLDVKVEEIISNLSINNLFSYIKYKDYQTILYMIRNNINTPLTSSMGRLFDGISAFLNFQNKVSYEGEACVELENLAKKSIEVRDYYKFDIHYENNQFIIDTDKIVEDVFTDVINRVDPQLISIKFHNTVVEFSFKICLYLRKLYNINIVALSGGLFENDIILTKLYEKLNSSNFHVLTHKILPCNDSNLYIGKLIIGMNKK